MKIDKIPQFSMKDLNGREGTIHVGVDWADGIECIITGFRDKETGKVHVIKEEYKKQDEN